jgi:beta-glucosidase
VNDWERKLVSKMTLEEKVAQLGSVPMQDLLDERGNFSHEKAFQLICNGIGQITRIAGGLGDPARNDTSPRRAAELANSAQRYLREKTRLGIPAIVHEESLSGFMADGATIFPQAIGLASTWNPDAVQAMASVIRLQMRAVGAHQALSPVLDLARDPRWGRVEETFGEDPYLVACMAVAYVRGLQGDDLRQGVMSTLKHFAGHSFSEGGRNCAPVHLGPRELRDTFLFPFEAAVKEASARSVMNAYHDIDGVPCAASRELLTEVLRKEWGFRGIVVSDYEAIDRLRSVHRTARDKREAAAQALEAGIDLELPRVDCYGQPLLEALREGIVPGAVLDEAVARVLEAKLELGLFDDIYVDAAAVDTVFDTPQQRALSRDIARQSIVLLKNDGGLLPLDKRLSSIAVIGPNADNPRNMVGDYTYMAHHSYETCSVRIVTVLEGIKSKVSSTCRVRYAKGCDVMDPSTDGFEEAIAAAKDSEVAVVVVGDRSGLFGKGTSGEGNDRANIGLPGVQTGLIKAVKETGTPTVVVLVNGRAFAIGEIADAVPAVLEAWFPGEEGGNAIADVLFGDYNPGGKLPISLPSEVGQIPVNYNLKPASYTDYLSTPARPAFAFGHGLSYTRFEYSLLEIEPPIISPDGQTRVSFEVTNTGDRSGDEVAQLYVRDEVASVARPVRELKGFKRVTLQPGERRSITFILYADQLAFHDGGVRLVVEPGAFEIMVGGSSEDIRLRGTLRVEGNRREVTGRRRFFARASP